MANRFNYAPRFRSGAVRVGATADSTWDLVRRAPPWVGNVDGIASAIGQARSHATKTAKTHGVSLASTSFAPRKAKPKTAHEIRYEAEALARERIIKAREMLEFALSELMDVPVPAGHRHRVTIGILIAAIDHVGIAVLPALPKIAGRHATRRPVLRECVNCGVPTVVNTLGYCEACAA